MPSYRALIKNWHRKAGEQNYFSKYVFEYLAFIAYLKTQLYAGYNENDRKTIQRLKRDERYKIRYISKIHTDPILRENWTQIQNELNLARLGRTNNDMDEVLEIEWWNCSHENFRDKTIEEQQKIRGILHSNSAFNVSEN